MAIKQFGMFLTKNSQYFDDIAKMDAPSRERRQRKPYEEVVRNQAGSRTIVIPFPCDIC